MTPLLRARRATISGIVLALVLTLCVDLAMLVVPIYDMQLYDRVLMSRNLDTLTTLSVCCVVGLVFYALLDFLRSACFLSIAHRIACSLHRPALEQIIRSTAAGGSASPQLVRDVDELRSVLASGIVATPLDALCTPLFVVVLYFLHPAFAWLCLCGISGLILANVAAELIVAPMVARANDCRRSADYVLSSSLRDADLVDGMGMLAPLTRRWAASYQRSVYDVSRATSWAHVISTISRLYRLVMAAAVMALGAILVIRGATTPGALMGANLLLNKSLSPFDHLVEGCRSWMKARQAWVRLSALQDYSPVSESAPIAAESGLRVDSVRVHTEAGEALLDNISFHLPAGTFAILKGDNGSGKTTLLRSIAGILTPTSGEIRMDGTRVGQGTDRGYMPHSVGLLDATVADNIGRLEPIEADVVAASRGAGVHELIGRMATGYATMISDASPALAGGVRQRIGLARALYGSPRLLLLDEPDASLDAEGVAALITAVRDCCRRGAIAVVISHRQQVVSAADIVIKLEAGRLVQQGAVLEHTSTPERLSA